MSNDWHQSITCVNTELLSCQWKMKKPVPMICDFLNVLVLRYNGLFVCLENRYFVQGPNGGWTKCLFFSFFFQTKIFVSWVTASKQILPLPYSGTSLILIQHQQIMACLFGSWWVLENQMLSGGPNYNLEILSWELPSSLNEECWPRCIKRLYMLPFFCCLEIYQHLTYWIVITMIWSDNLFV